MAGPKRKAHAKQHNSFESFIDGLDKALDVAVKDPESLPGHSATTEGNPINLGPRVAEADTWAEKQITNAVAASDRWLAGVTRPKKNPVESAIKATGKWKAKMQEALADESFAKGLGKVDIDEMYETITAGGSAPFASGIERRTAKVKRKVGVLRNLTLALTTELDKMPIDTDAQREAKMIAAKRGMQAIGKKIKGIA